MEEGELTKPTLPLVPDKCGPPTINLNFLLDFAVQQIYHEITVLTEFPRRNLNLACFQYFTYFHSIKLLSVK
uniref:Uncharacterized protein n=1 Tax=Heterorhabditis bacteriophora TaxID=37862 RepID=A0A1I7W8J9_HETBA